MKGFGFVMATKRLLEQKSHVMYMYREKPENIQDSGWRFFCGDEDEEYVSNPDNIAIVDVETVIGIDRSVKPYLSYPYGFSVSRTGESSVVVRQDRDS